MLRSFAALVFFLIGCASKDVAAPVVAPVVAAVVVAPDDVVAVVGDLAVGQDLFVHPWVPHDERSHGGDGLGPRDNASSCVACHNAGGVGGAGAANVRTLAGTTRNTPALFGAGLIDGIPDEVIEENAQRKDGERSHVDDLAASNFRLRRNGLDLPRGPDHPLGGRVGRTPEGFVTRFGWKGDVRDLHAFVTQACANELGLEVPGAHQPSGEGRFGLHALGTNDAVADALGELFGTRFANVDVDSSNNAEGPSLRDEARRNVAVAPAVAGYDLDLRELVSLTAFSASLHRPVEVAAGRAADFGRGVFVAIGCTDCHQERLGDVSGLYSDLLLHDMGANLSDPSGAYGQPAADENAKLWRTPPLWGVAVSAPYLHDGRAPTIEGAIRAHDGEGTKSREAYLALDPEEQAALLAFLGSLQAPASPSPSPSPSPSSI